MWYSSSYVIIYLSTLMYLIILLEPQHQRRHFVLMNRTQYEVYKIRAPLLIDDGVEGGN